MPKPLQTVCLDFDITRIAVAEPAALSKLVLNLKIRIKNMTDRLSAFIYIGSATVDAAVRPYKQFCCPAHHISAYFFCHRFRISILAVHFPFIFPEEFLCSEINAFSLT